MPKRREVPGQTFCNDFGHAANVDGAAQRIRISEASLNHAVRRKELAVLECLFGSCKCVTVSKITVVQLMQASSANFERKPGSPGRIGIAGENAGSIRCMAGADQVQNACIDPIPFMRTEQDCWPGVKSFRRLRIAQIPSSEADFRIKPRNCWSRPGGSGLIKD